MSVLVGGVLDTVDGSALGLGAQAARSLGTDMVIAGVLPLPWSTPSMAKVDAEYARWADDQAAQAEASSRAHLLDNAPDVPTTFVAVRGRSVPMALHAEIDRRGDVDLLVLGSAHATETGRIKIGSTAERLLHSSPVPVALTTCGYTPHADRIRHVTCAYANTTESEQVLSLTAEYAARIGADLRIVTFGVRGRTMYPSGVGYEAEEQVLAQWVEQSRSAQQQAIDRLGSALAPDTERIVATGDTWPAALADVPWRDDEVLVVGSALPGPIARVFVGSSASKIIRSAPVPVIAVPPTAVQELV